MSHARKQRYARVALRACDYSFPPLLTDDFGWRQRDTMCQEEQGVESRKEGRENPCRMPGAHLASHYLIPWGK